MGWDAMATKNGKDIDVKLEFKTGRKTRIVSRGLRKAFENAARGVVEQEGSADWLLRVGGLDCSDCAFALQEATGMSCWGDDLSPEKVKEYYESAYWDDIIVEARSKSLVASAKAFLEVCAKMGLGIRFSY